METSKPTSYEFLIEDWIDMARITNGPPTPLPQWTWHPEYSDSATLVGGGGVLPGLGQPSVPGSSFTNSVQPHFENVFKTEPDDSRHLQDLKLSSIPLDVKLHDPMTISTAFQPAPLDPSLPIPDIVLTTSDAVVFYVNQKILLKASQNCFNGLLPVISLEETERVRNLPDVHSSELNIILHILYQIDPSKFNPQLPFVASAIDKLPRFGYKPSFLITSESPVYKFLQFRAPLYPLYIYCLCGRHDLYELAVSISSHLLPLNLMSLTDEDAESMRSLYLARLFRLHRTRVSMLIQSLMPPPSLHNPTKKCGFEEQNALSSAWTLTTAYLSWSAKPGSSL
ncbi:hypothetical protein D9758_008358 [Tetrapyrgos nigripes]|uniref:BTB domain-containing protein n=1 Tax=Tetrapyrgos nigripes TaxID=182062 RepID=A0A8H5GE98_9AGAR|nr:hypothetical protein D9758_008358 [Tetrapyrgos nigripes]